MADNKNENIDKEESSDLDIEYDDSSRNWQKLVGEKPFITDCGEINEKIRYAVWVFKDGKHHVARVEPDKERLQKYFKVKDDMVFKFDLSTGYDVEKAEQKKRIEQKKQSWNTRSGQNDRSNKTRNSRSRL